MRAIHALLVFSVLAASCAAQAVDKSLLPIEPGTWVTAGLSFSDAPLAAIMTYDGHAISGPHSSRCTTTVLSQEDATYLLSTTCRGLGDGSAANPSTEIQRVVVESATDIIFENNSHIAHYHRVPSA
jgi:hypothetical protein